ncbi:MAG: glycosyl hydrolase family 28 protein [Pedobacter sp.]|uniref:glycoside hydrolase family 28 protein n=1 Tax=Pedobacter sp. TaxID=1411316 RepID=UPI003390A623
MKISLLSLLVCLCLSTSAQNKLYPITQYGAVADGKTNNTPAIQKAIDEAGKNGGGKVLVPAGDFVTGVLYLKSNVELNLAQNARLMATAKRADYGGKKASALIVGTNVHHISITGRGTIDGQAKPLLEDIYRMLNAGTLEDAEWKEYNDWHQMRPAEHNRPHLIDLTNCQSIIVKNITIRDGLCWIQDYRGCSDIVIDSITVESNTFLNNDGIDITDSKNVKITNSSVNVADDGICLKSSDANSGCENIYIANCKIRSSASGFKIGTASRGYFKNIKVSNLEIYDTYRSAIAIETVDGGNIENIDVRNVTARNTGNAIFIRLGKRRTNVAPGYLRNVYISDVKVSVPAGKPDAGYSMEGPVVRHPHNVFPSSIAGIPGHPVENVTLNNIEITYEGGASAKVAAFGIDSLEKVPEKIGDYPEFSMFGELPAWGFYTRHAAGLTMKNIKLNYQKADFRTACVFDDVSKLTLNNVSIGKAESKPVILMNKVTGSSLRNVNTPSKSKDDIRYQ